MSDTLGAILLGNNLAGKEIVRAGSGRRSLSSRKKRKRNCKRWLWKRMGFSMSSHPLKNFEIQKYYQNEPTFNGVFQEIIYLKKLKDGAYVKNFHEYIDLGAHWIPLFCNRCEIVYFDSFGVEHIPEESKEFVGNKHTIANTFRVQANN